MGMIEIFYNFNYLHSLKGAQALDKSETQTQLFRFDYVIGRLRDKDHQVIGYKSLDILMQLIGDVSSFDNIFIVDDMADRVWEGDIPRTLVNTSCKIFAIQALEFDIYAETYWDWDAVIAAYNRQRKNDKYLEALTHFIMLAQAVSLPRATNTLLWISQYSMIEYLRVYDVTRLRE